MEIAQDKIHNKDQSLDPRPFEINKGTQELILTAILPIGTVKLQI